MTAMLRIVLLLVSFCTLLFIIKKIRKSKIKLEDSVFWLIFAILLLLGSIFPQFFEVLAAISGVYATSNFVFLFFIFVLLIKTFSMSVQVSQMDTKIKELSQQLAIEKFERNQLNQNINHKQ
jgi:hypothetical protein